MSTEEKGVGARVQRNGHNAQQRTEYLVVGQIRTYCSTGVVMLLRVLHLAEHAVAFDELMVRHLHSISCSLGGVWRCA
jgi:hypothetical protein